MFGFCVHDKLIVYVQGKCIVGIKKKGKSVKYWWKLFLTKQICSPCGRLTHFIKYLKCWNKVNLLCGLKTFWRGQNPSSPPKQIPVYGLIPLGIRILYVFCDGIR